MHTKFIYLTYYVWRQVQRARTRCWLEWAPHSASTISVLNMTYSTPVPLVREGQGVSWVYFSFSFWLPLSQLKHHSETTLRHWMWLLDPSDQRLPTLFFLASSCASSSLLLFRSCSNLQISAFISCLVVHKITHPIRHPFPFLFSILCLLGQADMLLMQPLDFS